MEREETLILSLKYHQDKIGALYRFAQQQKTLENRIYALWEAVVDLIMRLFEQVNKSGILFSYPQPLLGGDEAFKRVMPDSGLYFTWMEGARDRVSPILFCEIKCLDVPNDWHTLDGKFDAQKLVHNHFGQISLQAFCGFHEFPKAEKIHIILLLGIYFTVLEFRPPAKLDDVPKPSKIVLKASRIDYPSPRLRQATGQKTIVELMPDLPQCLVFSECLFVNPNKEGVGLTFSNAFIFAIKSCFGHIGVGSCDLMDFVGAKDYKMPPDSDKGFQNRITQWYDRFLDADTETPKTPKRGLRGSMLETPTSAGKDYQITSDSSYSEGSSDAATSPPQRKVLTRKRQRTAEPEGDPLEEEDSEEDI